MFENHQLWLFLWFSWCFGVFLNLFFIRPYVLAHRKGGADFGVAMWVDWQS